MVTSITHLSTLDALLSNIDGPQKARVLRAVSEEFIARITVLSRAGAELYDEIILRVVTEVAVPVEAELAERLADLEPGPVRTVRHLARSGDVSVAEPLLQRSPLLCDVDLVEVARDCGQGHRVAIALRRDLSTTVTDVVVGRGEMPVLRAVAGNLTARFSPQGIETLVAASGRDEALNLALTRRTDLPADDLLDVLMSRARSLTSGKPAHAALSTVAPPAAAKAIEPPRPMPAFGKGPRAEPTPDADEGSSEEDAPVAPPPPVSNVPPRRDLATAEKRVAALSLQRELTDDAVARAVAANQWADAVALVAKLADQPVGVVALALGSPQTDPCLVATRAANLGWDVAEQVLTKRPGASGGGPGPLKAAYTKLTRQSAERALRFIQMRSKMNGAG